MSIRHILEELGKDVVDRLVEGKERKPSVFDIHNPGHLSYMIRKEPIRVAQRLLRIWGDQTEEMVLVNFPADIPDRNELLNRLFKAIKLQRERWETRNWNKGYVRTY